MPSTSGIMQKQRAHPSAGLPKQQTQPRRHGARAPRICFTEEPPQVFAYLDESSALAEEEWRAGQPISYDEYQRLVQSAADDAQAQLLQIARWRQQMQMKFVEREEALDGELVCVRCCG